MFKLSLNRSLQTLNGAAMSDRGTIWSSQFVRFNGEISSTAPVTAHALSGSYLQSPGLLQWRVCRSTIGSVQPKRTTKKYDKMNDMCFSHKPHFYRTMLCIAWLLPSPE